MLSDRYVKVLVQVVLEQPLDFFDTIEHDGLNLIRIVDGPACVRRIEIHAHASSNYALDGSCLVIECNTHSRCRSLLESTRWDDLN